MEPCLENKGSLRYIVYHEKRFQNMGMTFADILRDLRIKRNLSQQQLANQLFVNRSSIAHWESGSCGIR